MATIEERAKESVHLQYNCNGEYPCACFKYCIFGCGSNIAYDCEECGADEYQNGYIMGATEQRDIDIEKAAEWLNANWRKYIDTDADGMIRFSGWKKDFEKALKDESNSI